MKRTHPHLDKHEVELWRMVALSHTKHEIAEALGLSYKSIGQMRTRLYAKLGVVNIQGLVIAAFRDGIIDIPKLYK